MRRPKSAHKKRKFQSSPNNFLRGLHSLFGIISKPAKKNLHFYLLQNAVKDIVVFPIFKIKKKPQNRNKIVWQNYFITIFFIKQTEIKLFYNKLSIFSLYFSLKIKTASRKRSRPSQSVSRVLSSVIIYLDRTSPHGSSDVLL